MAADGGDTSEIFIPVLTIAGVDDVQVDSAWRFLGYVGWAAAAAYLMFLVFLWVAVGRFGRRRATSVAKGLWLPGGNLP